MLVIFRKQTPKSNDDLRVLDISDSNNSQEDKKLEEVGKDSAINDIKGEYNKLVYL